MNYEGAMTFVKWLTAPGKGQAVFGGFGKDKYGVLFSFPLEGVRQASRRIEERRTTEINEVTYGMAMVFVRKVCQKLHEKLCIE